MKLDKAAQNRSGDDQWGHQFPALDLTFDDRILSFQADGQVQKLVFGANFDHRNGGVLLPENGLEIYHHASSPAHILGADGALEEVLLKRLRFGRVEFLEQVAFGQIAIYNELVVQVVSVPI